MAIQIIVYSVATGRVRRVIDPQAVTPNAIAYLNQVAVTAGEARLLYAKQGGGADTLSAWQAAVNAHTGLNPDVSQADWHCVIDGANNVLGALLADPACGDASPLGTLVKAPWGAD